MSIQSKSVEDKNIGKRLDLFVMDMLSDGIYPGRYKEIFSRSFLSRYVKDVVKVNGASSKAGYKLRVGDIVEIDNDELEKVLDSGKERRDLLDRVIPQEPPADMLNIVAETEDFLVLNKPRNLVVHPGVANETDTLANYVRWYLEKEGSYDNMMDRAGIVHRLDKGVGGLMVIAKNLSAQRGLKALFMDKQVSKVYRTEVVPLNRTTFTSAFESANGKLESKLLKEDSLWSQNTNDVFMVEGYIERSNVNRMKYVLNADGTGKNAKFAHSLIYPISEDKCLVKILTGRTHQIRATMNYMGYVVKGDHLYGDSSVENSDRLELYSVSLGFEWKGSKFKCVL